VNAPKVDDPKLTPAVDMLRRTGAADVQIRWSDDEEPTVWFAVARYRLDPDGLPRPTGKVNGWETAAGHTPTEALVRLCQQTIDGGECAHCRKPTMFLADIDSHPTPLDPAFCITSWDPELATFRRGCE
jgi:hypothetical protein